MNYRKKAKRMLLTKVREAGGVLTLTYGDANPKALAFLNELVEEGRLTRNDLVQGEVTYFLVKRLEKDRIEQT